MCMLCVYVSVYIYCLSSVSVCVYVCGMCVCGLCVSVMCVGCVLCMSLCVVSTYVVCVWYVCMHVCACLDQRTTLGVITEALLNSFSEGSRDGLELTNVVMGHVMTWNLPRW